MRVPSLGDRGAEREARRTLGRHGVRTERAASDSEDDSEDDDGDARGGAANPGQPMYLSDEQPDLDPESDCSTSRAPSPSQQPTPQSAAPRWRWPLNITPSPSSSAPTSLTASPRRRRRVSSSGARGGPWTLTVPPHLNLAGTCFDPSGRYVYVASESGVVEWAVRGADKVWWSGGAWA